MARESTPDDDVTEDVFDTGDPRLFVDHLVLTERFRSAALEERSSPVHAMCRIGLALVGMATTDRARALCASVGTRLDLKGANVRGRRVRPEARAR